MGSNASGTWMDSKLWKSERSVSFYRAIFSKRPSISFIVVRASYTLPADGLSPRSLRLPIVFGAIIFFWLPLAIFHFSLHLLSHHLEVLLGAMHLFHIFTFISKLPSFSGEIFCWQELRVAVFSLFAILFHLQLFKSLSIDRSALASLFVSNCNDVAETCYFLSAGVFFQLSMTPYRESFSVEI